MLKNNLSNCSALESSLDDGALSTDSKDVCFDTPSNKTHIESIGHRRDPVEVLCFASRAAVISTRPEHLSLHTAKEGGT
ncbi:MAG TPA: hypothetical protein DCE42_20935 [Myxococcales bacterium]|nr:hypothetical protein [Deltaproteobacteria bacterium]MBU48159.1 hypothetical protein [Deltaproteobacteria bacterium]HAA57245.1 hypothetical protein [Myxococcales bacterium]